jgi:small multidrug resistance pump
MPAWLLLCVTILCEVTATLALRASDGFTKALPSVVVVAGYGLCFYLLARVLREFPIGFTYAVWSGAGTALIAIVGMVALGESAGAVKLLSLGLIVAGVVGLNLTASR